MRIRIGDDSIYVDFISVNGTLQLQAPFHDDYYAGSQSTIVVSHDQVQQIRAILDDNRGLQDVGY